MASKGTKRSKEEIRQRIEDAVNVQHEMPCICGHPAGFHDPQMEEMEISANAEKIKVVYLYRRCSWDDGDLGTRCVCDKFQMDNLKYLEQKANDRP